MVIGLIFFVFFFLGGKDIHYTSAMIVTSRVCDVMTMLASLWLCLADPTLCHASLVDKNKHVLLAGRLALV